MAARHSQKDRRGFRNHGNSPLEMTPPPPPGPSRPQPRIALAGSRPVVLVAPASLTADNEIFFLLDPDPPQTAQRSLVNFFLVIGGIFTYSIVIKSLRVAGN